MNLIYFPMGMVAAACSRMSRYRIYGVPSHITIVVFAATVALLLAADLHASSQDYGKPPVPYTVSGALDSAHRNDFVAITGVYVPEAQISGSDETRYELLRDPNSREGVLVENGNVTPEKSTVTGQLYRILSAIERGIADNGDAIGQYSVSPDIMLRFKW